LYIAFRYGEIVRPITAVQMPMLGKFNRSRKYSDDEFTLTFVRKFAAAARRPIIVRIVKILDHNTLTIIARLLTILAGELLV